ncbi:mitochondrial glutathione transporter SLC25A40 isoform X2 [Parasteatoda tepidariorum]|uniref:mitochondrial glutathione transporter SLC25A40 isoform X2 n=1 Tax=Parasteatoda tepidariorum TaxID=114398 RepID=UPI001C7208D6|nr:solute carrier family 25 member 40 isoform X2 [Parasteatoda tepidariorum]
MIEAKLKPDSSLAVSELIISSCSGAVLTSFFVTPFDVVKTRLQVQIKEGKAVKSLCTPYNCLWDDLCYNGKCVSHCKMHFKGTVDAFIKITKYEGISSLWSGLVPTLFMSVPSTVIYFTLYDKFREKLAHSTSLPKEMDFWIPVFAGVSARAGTVTAVSPIEFLRTKMQSEKIDTFRLYENIKELIKNKGILSLWRGLIPTLLRDAPFSAIYWSVYEQLKLHQDHPSILKTLIFGALSGSVAATITLPFDVIKTIRQSDLGIAVHHSSLVPRLMKVAPACAIMITSYEMGKTYFLKKKNNTVDK